MIGLCRLMEAPQLRVMVAPRDAADASAVVKIESMMIGWVAGPPRVNVEG